MKFESEREKNEIGTMLAKIKLLATINLNEKTPQQARVHSTIRIVELIGVMAARMGGQEFALTIPMYEAVIRAKLQEMKEAEGGNQGEEHNSRSE